MSNQNIFLAFNRDQILAAQSDVGVQIEHIMKLGHHPMMFGIVDKYKDAIRHLTTIESGGKVMRSDIAVCADVSAMAELSIARTIVLITEIEYENPALAEEMLVHCKKLIVNYSDLVIRFWGWLKPDSGAYDEYIRYLRMLALSIIAGANVGEAKLPRERKLKLLRTQNWQDEVWLCILQSLKILLTDKNPQHLAQVLTSMQALKKRKLRSFAPYIESLPTVIEKNLAAARLAILDDLAVVVSDRAGYANDNVVQTFLARILAGGEGVLKSNEIFLVLFLRYAWLGI